MTDKIKTSECTSYKNKYEGPCCHCGKTVLAGEDTFEKTKGKWKPLHLLCRPEFVRQRRLNRLQYWAQGTDKRARRARKTLRELEN